MKITGYGLREAIKQAELRRDTAAGAFSGSLKKFPDDEAKETPEAIVDAFTRSERALAALQVAQMRYNLAVQVELVGEKLTLAEAIKRVGGAGRIEKMWKGAIGDSSSRRHSYEDPDERDTTKIRAVRTVTASDAMKYATVAGKRAGALRAAISVANGKEVEIEGLDPALFE